MNFPMKVISLAKDYVDLGEAAVKIFWNPFAGDFKGYEQAIDEVTGQPMLDEDGQPAADEMKPVFTGRLEIEKILPTNLFRESVATSMDESAFLGIRKMVPIEDAKKFVGDDPDKIKLLEPSSREEYMVFEPNLSDFQSLKGQVLFKEYYFRPCVQYPNGYFFITTTQGILFEGELPYGIFPIHYVGFDETQSSPRHRSIIKQLRPYQMEINRTASKIAEHQVTSDDKILIQNGTKISSGGVLPGVRAIQYSGAPPTVLEGRAGSQYVEYMNGQISEMYQVANLSDDEKATPGVDPYGLLFRSVKEQKKFTINIEKFENFIKQIVTTHQRLAKKYIPDEKPVSTWRFLRGVPVMLCPRSCKSTMLYHHWWWRFLSRVTWLAARLHHSGRGKSMGVLAALRPPVHQPPFLGRWGTEEFRVWRTAGSTYVDASGNHPFPG
jgi:hypothetical protein